MSLARESFILYRIEREEVEKIRYLQTSVDTNILANIRTQESIQAAMDLVQNYRDFILPYMNQDGTINSKDVTEDTVLKMKEVHEKNKLAFITMIAKSKEKQPELNLNNKDATK